MDRVSIDSESLQSQGGRTRNVSTIEIQVTGAKQPFPCLFYDYGFYFKSIIQMS